MWLFVLIFMRDGPFFLEAKNGNRPLVKLEKSKKKKKRKKENYVSCYFIVLSKK